MDRARGARTWRVVRCLVRCGSIAWYFGIALTLLGMSRMKDSSATSSSLSAELLITKADTESSSMMHDSWAPTLHFLLQKIPPCPEYISDRVASFTVSNVYDFCKSVF